jgi:hypothetical protein
VALAVLLGRVCLTLGTKRPQCGIIRARSTGMPAQPWGSPDIARILSAFDSDSSCAAAAVRWAGSVVMPRDLSVMPE